MAQVWSIYPYLDNQPGIKERRIQVVGSMGEDATGRRFSIFLLKLSDEVDCIVQLCFLSVNEVNTSAFAEPLPRRSANISYYWTRSPYMPAFYPECQHLAALRIHARRTPKSP